MAVPGSDITSEEDDESVAMGLPAAVWGILLLACLLRIFAVLLRFENIYVEVFE